MQPQIIIATLLPLLAAASPVNKRAGGPSITPIPSNCKLPNPIPNSSTKGLMVNPDFASSNSAYAFYLSDPSQSKEDQAKQCFEQCYGLGGEGGKPGCVSAVMAHQVKIPQGYYGAGNMADEACIMFKEPLSADKFVNAPDGHYVYETAANIECPQ